MPKIRWKRFMLATAIIALALSGCSSPTQTKESAPAATPGSSGAGAGGDQQQVLKVLKNNFSNELDKQLWDGIVAKFEELHPDIDVELSAGDVSIESGKLTTLLQSGIDTPDVIMIDTGPGRIRTLSEVKLIQPLNDFYKEYKWDEKLDPYAYEKILRNSGTDTLFELPLNLHGNTIYYNKNIFKEVGVEVPKTWNEYMGAMQKIKDAGYTPLTVGARNGYAIGWLFSNLMESVAGRDAVDRLIYSAGLWNDPGLVDTAQTLIDFVDKGFIPKEAVTQTQQDSEFTFLGKETSATVVAGNNFINKVVDAKMEDHVGWFAMPSIHDGTGTGPTGGVAGSWVIPTGAASPKLGALWLDYTMSKEYSEVMLGNPANTIIPASKAAKGVPVASEMMSEIIQALAVDTAYNPTVYIGVEAKEAYYQNLQGLIGGLVTAQEAMNNIEAGAEKDRANGYTLTK